MLLNVSMSIALAFRTGFHVVGLLAMSISFLGQQQRVDNLGVAYCETLDEFVFGQIVTDALLERGLPKKEEVRHAMEVAFHLAAAACCFHQGGSAPENGPPEAPHGDGKIDRADDEHGQKRAPDEGEISAAEQHRLRKADEMRCRRATMSSTGLTNGGQ